MKAQLAISLGSALLLSTTAGQAQQIEFDINDTVEIEGLEVAYSVDLGLRALSLTRLEIDAMLDLRDLQQKLPELLSGEQILALCGNDTISEEISVTARDEDISLEGKVASTFFRCERVDDTTWKRREEKDTYDFDVAIDVSAELRNNCVYLRLTDATVEAEGELAETLEAAQNLSRVRTLLVEAIGLILDDAPFCPDLPPEILALDPVYETAGPKEIPDGGLGIALRGSVDTSTSTVIGILEGLQREGALPARP